MILLSAVCVISLRLRARQAGTLSLTEVVVIISTRYVNPQSEPGVVIHFNSLPAAFFVFHKKNVLN